MKMDYNNSGKPTSANTSFSMHILRLVQGALVGISAILPGISGGILCVTFGIYQPLIALLSHPIRTFRIYYKMFIPFGIGWVIGFLGLARIVEVLFVSSSAFVICLFAGLIAGTLPSLLREANKQTDRSGSWSGFIISLIAFFALFSYIKSGTTVDIEPNHWWYFLCGVIWGLSIVIPGLSSSSILIFLGLFQDVISLISDVRINLILPILIGIVLSVLLTARAINYLLEKHYSLIIQVILGIVISSTLIIIPTGFTAISHIILGIICFAAGYAISLKMSRIGANKG